MKVLFFSGTLSGGGAERVLANLSNEMSKHGLVVAVSLNEDSVAYELSPNIELIVAPKLKHNSGLNPFVHLLSWVERNIRNFKHTRDSIQAVKPDVIVTMLQCNMIPILFNHGNIPIVHSEHNAYDRKLGFKNHFNRFFLNRFFDKVCLLTYFDKGFASAKGVKNAIVMPNPNTFVSLTESKYEELYPLRKNILMCGRISAWHVKGLDIALHVFSQIAQRFPNIDLDIAGAGDEKSFNHLKAMAERLGVAKRVHFLGLRRDIMNLYQQHQVLLMSSRTEGFPMVITEAMSQGLPCVAFERLASSIIVDGKDGILASDGDENSLRLSLECLLSDSDLRHSYGKAAIANINRFAPERIVNRWEKIFQHLVNEDSDETK